MAAKGNQSKIKGNPASHRMGNENLKRRRAESWARGQKRKAERRAEAEARHRANVEAGITKWEIAKAKRIANS